MPIAKKQLISGALQVCAGIIDPLKLLDWIRANTAPPYEAHDIDLDRTIALQKFWLEAFEAKRVSEPWLRRQLGYWLMGMLDATSLAGLEFKPRRGYGPGE